MVCNCKALLVILFRLNLWSNIMGLSFSFGTYPLYVDCVFLFPQYCFFLRSALSKKFNRITSSLKWIVDMNDKLFIISLFVYTLLGFTANLWKMYLYSDNDQRPLDFDETWNLQSLQSSKFREREFLTRKNLDKLQIWERVLILLVMIQWFREITASWRRLWGERTSKI